MLTADGREIESVVYLAITLDGSAMKIGVTTNLRHRYDGLNRSARNLFGQQIRYLAVMPGGRDLERELLNKYHLALTAQTEWFMPLDGIVKEFIQNGMPAFAFHQNFCEHGVRLCACEGSNGIQWDWKDAPVVLRKSKAGYIREWSVRRDRSERDRICRELRTVQWWEMPLAALREILSVVYDNPSRIGR